MEAGLGISETDTWYMIETIAGKNNIGYKHIVSYIVLMKGHFLFTVFGYDFKYSWFSSMHWTHFAVQKPVLLDNSRIYDMASFMQIFLFYYNSTINTYFCY